MLRISARCVSVLCALLALTFAAEAWANPRINVQIFRPSAHPGDLINTWGSDIPENGFWSASTMLSFGKNPLVFVGFVEGNPTPRRHEVVQNQFTHELMGSYALFEWVDIGLNVPIHWVNSGEDDGFADTKAFNTVAFGDIRLDPKVRILRRSDDTLGFGLAASAMLVIPTGDPDGFVSDGFSWQPGIIADWKGFGLHLSTNLGVRIRDTERVIINNQPFLTVGHEFYYRFGAAYRILGEEDAAVITKGIEVTALAELHGATGDFSENTSNLEGLIGGQLYLPDVGITAKLGGGSGMVAGYGNTKFRIFMGVGFTMPVERDTDSDGFIDDEDKCPMEAEDVDQFEDEDGCPDLDNDADGVVDSIDRCPNDPEDKDRYEDTDGCPELDNDGDQVPDATDKCPLEPEDADQFEDEDGCPESDNDGDKIPDAADQCPNEVETINGFQDDDGCPDKSLARIENAKIVILDKIYFEYKTADLQPKSFPVLQAVAGILKVNPQVTKVRIDGHTDDKGRNKANLELSQLRADSVKAFLVSEGIEATRLDAIGKGEEEPSMEGKTDEAREANRRVEFHIVD